MIATWIGRSLAPYRKYAVFSGRSDVAEYLAFCSLQVLAFLAMVIAVPAEVVTLQEEQGPLPGWFSAYIFFWVLSIPPWFALISRRFHDQGRTGKLAWLALTPWLALGFGTAALAVLIWIGLLLWLAMPGQRQENAYGPPQLENAMGEAVPESSEADLEAAPESRVAHGSEFLGRKFDNGAQARRAQRRFGLKLGGHDSLQSDDGADVQLRGDGRYHAKGYSFTTLQQAEAFVARERRRQLPISHRPSTLPAALHSPVRPTAPVPARSPATTLSERPTLAQEEPEASHRIRRTADNRYGVKGFSFATLQQAEAYLARTEKPGLPADTPRLPIGDSGRPPAPPPASAVPAPRPAPQPASSRKPSNERWIHEPETVEIGSQNLVLELTYFGKAKDRYAWPSHNSLIDPTLPVAHEGTWEELGYWPNYAQMSPRQRRNYIDWLASGRRDPATPVGYVFVYFYGLERRLTLDHSRDAAEPILAELQALHAVYGSHHSFDRYATKLIEFAEYQTGGGSSELTPEVARALHNGYELPLRVRVALGQALSGGGGLDADQALCWALAAPGSYLRTPATRCFDQLCELWRIRFAEQHPEGLKVRLGKRHIEGQYRPASGGYSAEISFPDLPDVASFSTERLQRMLDDCTTALDGYSRFLGRNPALAQTAQAAALLPPELRSGKAGGALADAREKFEQIVGENEAGRGGTTFGELRAILSLPILPAGEKVAARDMKDMADVLDAMDFGFEPDRRFGKVGPLLPRTPVALFSAPDGGHVDSESQVYSAARVMAEISALAAISDGVAVEEELRSVARDLAQFGLSRAETSRLLALVHAILIDPPHSRAAMRRALELPNAERTRIANAAIGAVLADGKVLPAEVRFLEALHKTLGLNAEDVYSRLHRGAVEEELASVAPAIVRAGAEIPEEERKRAAVAIDEGRLARIKQETSAVSVLLSEIFEEEEMPPSHATPAVSTGEHAYHGLDSAHSQLLDALLQGAMPRAVFDETARELKLMPAGAIETINDWAFEQFGEAALDDDDPVAIIEYLQSDIAGVRGQS